MIDGSGDAARGEDEPGWPPPTPASPTAKPTSGASASREVKYLKRGETADEAAVAARLREARTQLGGYLAAPALRAEPAVRHVGLAVVFHGWELAACEAVGDDDG